MPVINACVILAEHCHKLVNRRCVILQADYDLTMVYSTPSSGLFSK